MNRPDLVSMRRLVAGLGLQYPSRALADYDQAQRRKYEDHRKERLAEIRATTLPNTLTAVEQADVAQFDQDNTNPFGRDLMRRIAIDNALAAHFNLPSFEEWRATRGETQLLKTRPPGVAARRCVPLCFPYPQ